MGLTNKSIELTEDIHGYLKDISCLSNFSSLSLLICKGTLLIRRTELLMKDLEDASKDKEIELTALQIRKALEIELKGLRDVVDSLETADKTVILAKNAVLEAEIIKIKEYA